MKHIKDFDTWNKNKKDIHDKNEHKLYHEREVWWCSLGVNIGFEQDGTGEDKDRPVIIIKGFSRQVCIVLPLTTSNKKNPYHFYLGKVDSKEAWAIVSQIRLVDTKRLIDKVCFIEKDIFEELKKTVKNVF